MRMNGVNEARCNASECALPMYLVCQSVEFIHRQPLALVDHLRIDLGCLDVGMAENLAHRLDGHFEAQQKVACVCLEV